jgi:hypothetical protein
MCQYVATATYTPLLATRGSVIPPNFAVAGSAGTNTQNSCGPLSFAAITNKAYTETKGDQAVTDPCPNNMLNAGTLRSTWYQTYELAAKD